MMRPGTFLISTLMNELKKKKYLVSQLSLVFRFFFSLGDDSSVRNRFTFPSARNLCVYDFVYR